MAAFAEPLSLLIVTCIWTLSNVIFPSLEAKQEENQGFGFTWLYHRLQDWNVFPIPAPSSQGVPAPDSNVSTASQAE
jgi:hypothetical protein